MKFTPQAVLAVRPATVKTMADVRSILLLDGPAYLLNAVRMLQTHVDHIDLEDVPACFEYFDENFPKPRRGIHPRPDLTQNITAYQKWCSDIRRAIEITSGIRQEKVLRSQRNDGWKQLLAAIKLHSSNGGLIHAAASGPVTKLADVCRIAGLEPWDLCDMAALKIMEDALQVAGDRPRLRTALAFLAEYSFIPEIGALLPENGVAQLPNLRGLACLPDAIEIILEQMVQKASSERDLVVGMDCPTVSDSTRVRYFAALRHHLRTLPLCPPEPAMDYQPITNIAAVNNVHELFTLPHLKAGVRFAALDEEAVPVRTETVAAYYFDIVTILRRNGLITESDVKELMTSRLLRNGRARYASMVPETEEWCRKLISDQEVERRFRNLHRVFMAKAHEIRNGAHAVGRDLTPKEISRIRTLGVAAAAAAIEYAGRPIRKSNVLHLRLRGSRQNFFLPSQVRETYEFELSASETKANKKEFRTEVSPALHGKTVLDWYLQEVRPLFPTASKSIYLFPSMTNPEKPFDGGLFDIAFQRAASEVGIPMTFHKWRHGYASLLLKEDWNNLPVAADMLGNTIEICARSYAFIDKQALYRAGQKKMVESAKRYA